MCLFVIFFLALGCGVATAAEYKVGDEPGWTRQIPVDYYQWASDKTFYVGDTLFFQYHLPMHDVTEVTAKNFMQCNARNPIAVHRTGADKIELRRTGHHFFICGTPGHCEAGMKLMVRVAYKPGQSFEKDSKNPDADTSEENSLASAPVAGETPEANSNGVNFQMGVSNVGESPEANPSSVNWQTGASNVGGVTEANPSDVNLQMGAFNGGEAPETIPNGVNLQMGPPNTEEAPEVNPSNVNLQMGAPNVGEAPETNPSHVDLSMGAPNENDPSGVNLEMGAPNAGQTPDEEDPSDPNSIIGTPDAGEDDPSQQN